MTGNDKRWRHSAIGCSILAASILMFGIASRASSANSPLGLPVPPGTELQRIGEHMSISGLPVTVFSLNSTQSVDALVAFYQGLWATPADGSDTDAAGPGFMHDRLGEAHVISQLKGSINTVVQIQLAPGGGAMGSLSQVDLSTSMGRDATMKSIAMPPGGRLLSFTRSSDGDRHGATWLASFNGHRDLARRFYENEMQRAGWTLASRRHMEGHTVLMFDGNDARLDVVIGGDIEGDTLIVINRETQGAPG